MKPYLKQTPANDDRDLIKDVHFKEISRDVKPDAKNRIALGKLPFKADYYTVFVNELGQIVLDPRISIPASEVWLFKNKKALASVAQGLADAKAGRLVKAREDYSKYLKDEK